MPASRRALASTISVRRGMAVRVVRIPPVEYSELMVMTPRT